MSSHLDTLLTIDDLKSQAKAKVPKLFYDYVDSGSWTESTYRANQSDFQKLLLKQKVMVDISERNLTTNILGKPSKLPFAMAPTGLTGMLSANGEVKAAKACEQAGIPFTLSTMSICPIEDIAANTENPFWFQLYMMKDKNFIQSLIERAKAANCSALVLTCDLQILGQRHKDIRNQLSAPPKLTIKHLLQMASKPAWCAQMLSTNRREFGNIVGHVKGVDDMSSLSSWISQQFDTCLSWQDIEWIKTIWNGPLILKGILTAQDAIQAANCGADAIVVSNHGGRQLDYARSSIAALASIVDAVGSKVEIHMDGGIYQGQDVLKTLCLGAKSVFLGRALLYGLGAGGQVGVSRAIDIIEKELDITMALCGERDINKVGRHNLDECSQLIREYQIEL